MVREESLVLNYVIERERGHGSLREAEGEKESVRGECLKEVEERREIAIELL